MPAYAKDDKVVCFFRNARRWRLLANRPTFLRGAARIP